MNKTLMMFNHVKKFRLEKGWTQSDLGLMCGLSQNTISALENFDYGISAYNAASICRALDKTFEEVFYFEWVEDSE